VALYTVTTGNVALAADLNQVVNLLNGSDTATQLTISNRIRAQFTGATAASGYVGGTASGAPVSGTFAVGDFAIDQTGIVWICTTAGSPGTWTKAGVALGSATPQAISGAGSAGSAANASHEDHTHPNTNVAMTNLANTFSSLQTMNSGLSLSNNSSNTVPTLPSASGARIWVQSSDPAGSAANGDIWIQV
jgi:hypothetical protein